MDTIKAAGNNVMRIDRPVPAAAAEPAYFGLPRRLHIVVRLVTLVSGTLLFPAVALSDEDHDRRDKRIEERHERKEDRREERHEQRREDRPATVRAPVPRPLAAPMPPTFRAEPRGPIPGQAAAPLMRGGPVMSRGPGFVGAPVVRGAPPTAPRAFHPRFAPPPPIVERPPVRPGFVWVGGYYDWNDDRYVWTNGHYETERPDVYWRAPRWELQGGVFSWLPGGWISLEAEPVVAPPPPRAEAVEVRPGFIWIPGYYEWRGNQYAWVSGRWEQERSNERWLPGRWERHGNHWSWRQGGWHRHR